MITKKCFKCHRTKCLDLFYKHKQMADGHLNKCKACAKKDAKNRYYSPEGRIKIREYEQERFKTEHRKIKVLEYQRNRNKKNKGKARARRNISNLIRSGNLIRLPCEICGNQKSQAHHLDYRSPLKIKWLCFKHHRILHGQKPNH